MIRDDREKVVAVCGHLHRNRDQTPIPRQWVGDWREVSFSPSSSLSAWGCAQLLAAEAIASACGRKS